MKSKFVIGILGVALIFGLAGCGQESSEPAQTQTDQAAVEETQVAETEDSAGVQNGSIIDVKKVGDNISFEYDGYNFVLPGYLTLDKDASSDGYLEFMVGDGDYDHQAYVMVEKSEDGVTDDDDFRGYKQSMVESYRGSEAHEILETTDIDINDVSALYMSMTSTDEELSKLNTGEFLIYNPDNGDIINIYIWDYEGDAQKPSIDDFKIAIEQSEKL